MKNLKHPNFILAIVSALVLLIGIIMRVNGYAGGDYVVGASVVLGAIHWIWAIIDVTRRDDLKPKHRIFWLIGVIACPLMGAMIFYAMHQERNKYVT